MSMRDRIGGVGPAWLERCLRQPADGVPYHKTGSVTGIVTGTEGVLFADRLPGDINGLRVAGIVWEVSAGNVLYNIRLYKDGNRYDEDLGDLHLGGSTVPIVLPVFAVYPAGALVELRIENNTGVNRDVAGGIFGWLF